MNATLFWVAQKRAEVTNEHAAKALSTLQNVALVLAHMLESIHQAIIHPLRAVLGAGFVMEIDDIQSETFCVCRISVLGRS